MSDGRLPVRRRWIGWAVGILLSILLLALGWVSVRGIGAVNELQKVADGATQLKTTISAGDLESATPIAARIAANAASAHDLTSDPIWQAFGAIPWLGPNFRAVGEIAEIADNVSTDALTPLLEVAADFDLASLGFSGGAIDLAPFAEIAEPLGVANTALSTAQSEVRQIDADATLPPLAEAIGQMRSAVTEAATVVGSLHGAAVLLPTMLGGEGPRTYVLAMQNNAELRSSGGIIGSIALLRADNGKISLQTQASTRDFPPLDTALPLSDSTIALFDDRPGRYLQNITSIPDFTEAGATIAARWEGRFGGTVDGVIAVDAVVAENLMAATGDLAFGPFTASADNVTDILLSEIYAAVPDPAVQDQIFAKAASVLFSAAMSGADPQAMVGALAKSAAEGRVRIWSAHEDEQELLASSALGGAIPADSDDATYVGVLMNDTTGGKMDYYTRASITTAMGNCSGSPTTHVQVTWTNTAPADAATSLPAYVTGDGVYGVPAGTVRTLIGIYGPEGATPASIDRDGAEEGVQTTLLGDRVVVQHEVSLAPGESTTITINFEGGEAGNRLTEVLHTPLVAAPEITQEPLQCTS
ncbi:DUF4012 domain-containing protein [Microbacterium sp. NPDC076768]|uniref:DUF4012 domain-containing protein n=1 Tax=Microbacterium sp. NPDC076768 TaxID=3154858 RepID=UPI0034490294